MCSNLSVTETLDIPRPTADDFGKDFRDSVRILFNGILVPAVCGIGSVLNLITFAVMTRPSMRSSSNNYLAIVGLCDGLYLASSLILGLQHDVPTTLSYNFYRRMLPLLHLVTDFASNSSVWLIVCFTTQRYVAVCHPLKAKCICTISRSIKVIAAAIIFCLVLTLPTLFEYELTTSSCDHSIVRIVRSPLARNAAYQTAYYWLTAVLFILFPLILLTFFNVRLIQTVRESAQKRTELSSAQIYCNSISERKATIMCIAVVLLFLVCQSPSAGLLLYTAFPSDHQSNIVLALGNIFNFLVCINAAGNFCLYCLFGPKYRQTLARLLASGCGLAARDHRGYMLLNSFRRRNQIGYFVPSMHPKRHMNLDTRTKLSVL